ncbi:MAG: PD-(D/E)XK nuclease family protein [Oscillospiraceae bacterium]|nr:PD-(D/E)XK nuclease family protein [Oscillospiraceae bacterium]
MLTLFTGPAKTGKTGAMMAQLAEKIKNGIPCCLVCPEQYSFEAETALLKAAGNTLSRYGEVLPFSRLYNAVRAEKGGCTEKLLDKGGKLLCLTLALNQLEAGRLHFFKNACRSPEKSAAILESIDELNDAGISPSELKKIAAGAPSPSLSAKLTELSTVMEAYTAISSASGLDPRSRLSLLEEMLPKSSYAGRHFYFDGFLSFTGRELSLIKTLVALGADVTVALMCEGLSPEEGHEIFEPGRKAGLKLISYAKLNNAEVKIVPFLPADKEGSVGGAIRKLFGFSSEKASLPEGKLTVLAGKQLSEECEAAAAEILRLVKKGCRFRDIALASPSFEADRNIIEGVFRRYGIPLNVAVKESLRDKALPLFIASAYRLITRGFDSEDMRSYLSSGLTGLSDDDRDTLENYVFRRAVSGRSWERDWISPSGEKGRAENMDELNAIRRQIITPLLAFREAGAKAETGREQAIALMSFFDDIGLPERLAERACALKEAGLETQAENGMLIWGTVVGAMEQCAAAMGEMSFDAAGFGKLFLSVICCYELASIPTGRDGVMAGNMSRMRRMGIKHLFLISADNSKIPAVPTPAGVLSELDRELMRENGGTFIADMRTKSSEEFSQLASCLLLPSESLHISCSPSSGESGAGPSFIMNRAAELLGLDPEKLPGIDTDACRAESAGTLTELAAKSRTDHASPFSRAADALISDEQRERLNSLRLLALDTARTDRLSADTITSIYGHRLHLSASKVEKYADCRFAYFMQFGLDARARKPEVFDASRAGTFIHDVLRFVFEEIKNRGGLGRCDDDLIAALALQYTDEYAASKLLNFADMSSRSVYLFRRLKDKVRKIVLDIVSELRQGSFEPLEFELDLKSASVLPPEDFSGTLDGYIDRVDGWLHDGRIYLRIVDYKTGTKHFSLSDVLYGKNLQMLIYLFALKKLGEGFAFSKGKELIPAGIEYIHASDELVPLKMGADDEKIDSKVERKINKRVGLFLKDVDVLQAMEPGLKKQYIPVRIVGKTGELDGKTIASAERFGKLGAYIDSLIEKIAQEIKDGDTSANPYCEGESTPCKYCDFREACRFDEARDGYRHRVKQSDEFVWDTIDRELGASGQEA